MVESLDNEWFSWVSLFDVRIELKILLQSLRQEMGVILRFRTIINVLGNLHIQCP